MTLKWKIILSTSWWNVTEKSPTVKACRCHILIKQPNISLRNPSVTYTGAYHLWEDVLWLCEYFQLRWLRMGGAYREENPDPFVLHRNPGLLSTLNQSCLYLAGKWSCRGYHDHTASGTWARLVLITRKVRYSRFGTGQSPLMLTR